MLTGIKANPRKDVVLSYGDLEKFNIKNNKNYNKILNWYTKKQFPGSYTLDKKK